MLKKNLKTLQDSINDMESMERIFREIRDLKSCSENDAYKLFYAMFHLEKAQELLKKIINEHKQEI